MRMNRRNALIGLGAVATGAGAVFGSGAFTSVDAERTASVSVADDANAFLALEIHSDRSGGDDFIQTSGGQIEFSFDGDDADDDVSGLLDDAVTRFDNLLTVTNNGTNEVELTLDTVDADGDSVDIGLTGYDGADEDTTEPFIIGTGISQDIGFEFDLTDTTDNADDVTDIVISANDTTA